MSEQKSTKSSLFQEEVVLFSDIASDSVLEKNLQTLGAFNGFLVESIRKTQVDGLTFFKSRRGAIGVRDGDTYLTSRYDPEGEMRPQVKKLLDESPRVAMVYGIGLGYHLREILTQFDGVVFLYEHDLRLFRAALSVTDLSKLLPGAKLVVANRVEDVNYNFMSNQHLNNNVTITHYPVALGAYRRLYPDNLQRFEERLRVLQRDADVSLSTTLIKSQTWYKYLLKNLPTVHDLPDLGCLWNKFEDTPVILVASGPSLSKNYQLLEKVRGRACIFTVGTALKKLTGAGIIPDMTMAIEANDIVYQFDELEELQRIHLILSLKCNPGLYNLNSRSKLITGELDSDMIWAMTRMGRDKPFIQGGGSVANEAFSVIRKMGAKTIILIGQDLALGEDGQSHADGTGTGTDVECFFDNLDATASMEKIQELHDRGIEFTDGYHGGKVATRFHWSNYRMWFERRAVELAGSDVRLINATEGGAMIHGFEQMPLEQVIAEVLPESMEEVPADRLDRLVDEFKQQPVSITLRELKEDLRQLKKVRRVTNNSKNLIRKVFESLNGAQTDRIWVDRQLVKLEKFEASLMKLMDRVDPLISPLTREQVVIVNNCFDEQEGDKDIQKLRQNLNQSHVLHVGVNKATDLAIPMLEDVIEDLMDPDRGVNNVAQPQHLEGVSHDSRT